MVEEAATQVKKHHIIEHAESIVRDRVKYRPDYNSEHVALYAYFYGCVTSILRYKQAPSKTVKEIHELQTAFEIASKIIKED